jgi:hypothetical protein
MFNGIEIPGIHFQNQKMNDEIVQYNNKVNNNQKEQLVVNNYEQYN